MDPRRVIAEGYDRMGAGFSEWNDARPRGARTWFLGEVLARVGEGSRILELGCGPGTDAAALSYGRRYIGIDLSPVQLAIARHRASGTAFVVGDFTRMAFRPASLDGVAAFFAFNHVPKGEVEPTFARIYTWLRPGGRLMTSLLTIEAEDRVEEWLGVPMFFAGVDPDAYDRALRVVGFELELSEVREEVDTLYGPTQHRWVIARKPDPMARDR